MGKQLIFQIVFTAVFHHGIGTVNFALHRSAVQSTTLYFANFNWTADKAVDGNTDGSNPENSRTCSATTRTQGLANHTWEVDIGLQIIVQTITVYGRTDQNPVNDQLKGVKLYLGNTTGPWINSQELPSYFSNDTQYVFKPNDVIARVISLMRSSLILTICEVTVEGECLVGMFSEFCNKTCGKCFAGQPCNKETGTCPLGCDQGWKGTFCKEGCERGNYGYNCNETCGNCLYGNNSCSTSDGNCANGCKAGWQGYHCTRGCDAGQYGYNCNETCGNCLYGNNSCSTSDGRCTNRCNPGWRGDDCKIECEAGSYGFNCNETCGYCVNGNDICSKINGNCSGVCQAGWTGETCKAGMPGMVNPVDLGPNAGVIVGSVLAAVGVSIFTIVIIIVIMKNRRKRDTNETSTENVITTAHDANLVVGKPDATCKITVNSTTEKTTTFSANEEASLKRGMPSGTTDSHSGVKELDYHVGNDDYEKLGDNTGSTESAYSTIHHSLIDDQKMETMENCNNYIETLQSLDNTLKSVEEEISVLLDRKETLLCKELERARANKLRDKRKKKDSSQSDRDQDYTYVDDQRRDELEHCNIFFQMLHSLEGELRILEEKRKFFLGSKENLLRQELAKTSGKDK